MLRKQSEAPPSNDPRIAAYAEALHLNLEYPGPVQDFFDELLSIRADMGPSHLSTKVLRAAQAQLYGNYPGYPQEFLTAGKWQEGLDWIFGDPDRAGQFTVDVWTRPLQSNKSDRYKSLKAFGVLARQFGRLGLFNIMDVGCSQNAGLHHLASGMSFDMPAVVRPDALSTPSVRHTTAFHRVLGSDIALGESVGIDIYSPDDSRKWAWSCSHYPSELLDEVKVGMFRELIDATYPQVSFFKGNFADFNHGAFTHKHPRFKPSIVNFSTILYQAGELERAEMLANAAKYAQEFIVVQDFLGIDPDDNRKLVFRDDWQDDPFPYRMVVRDMQEEDGRWHEVFKWRDGRCREVALGMGRLALRQGTMRPFWSALDAQAWH